MTTQVLEKSAPKQDAYLTLIRRHPLKAIRNDAGRRRTPAALSGRRIGPRRQPGWARIELLRRCSPDTDGHLLMVIRAG